MSTDPSTLPLTRAEEDADVAFALEGMPAIEAVYAVPDARAGEYRYVVTLVGEMDGYAVAEIHYALLRSRGTKTTSDVDVRTSRPSADRHRWRPIVLEPRSREAARARARKAFLSEVLKEQYVQPGPIPEPRLVADMSGDDLRERILVVDEDPATLDAVHRLEGPSARIVHCPYADTAVALVACWPYDRLVVGSKFAFGEDQVLARLIALDPLEIVPIVVVVQPDDIPVALDRAASGGRWQVASAPLHTTTLALRFGLRKGWFAGTRRLGAAVAGKRSTTRPAADGRASVLLVDRTLEAVDAKRGVGEELDVVIVTSLVEAVRELRVRRFSAVLCDGTLREGPVFTFREIWSLFPEVRAKTVLVAPRESVDAIPASRSSERRLVARPLTAAVLIAAVKNVLSA